MKIAFILLLLLLQIFSYNVLAEKLETYKKAMNSKVSLPGDKWEPVQDVLQHCSEQTGINIIIDETIFKQKGPVFQSLTSSIRWEIKDRPLLPFLEFLLIPTRGMGYEIRSEGIWISLAEKTWVGEIKAIGSKIKQGVVRVTYEIILGPGFLKNTKPGLNGGFVVNDEGYILTISPARTEFGTKNEKVKTSTGDEFKAKIVAIDKKIGAALLKIDKKQPLPKLPFGDIKKLLVDEDVFVVVNNYGEVFNILKGVVSKIDLKEKSHMVEVVVPSTCIYWAPSLSSIDMDARGVGWMTSGSPLLNRKGEAIGIITSIKSGEGHTAFCTAVSINAIMEKLGKSGKKWVGF